MSRAQKCPVCYGSGQYNGETCHGCGGRGGRGWVTVQDSVYPPPRPVHPVPTPPHGDFDLEKRLREALRPLPWTSTPDIPNPFTCGPFDASESVRNARGEIIRC